MNADGPAARSLRGIPQAQMRRGTRLAFAGLLTSGCTFPTFQFQDHDRAAPYEDRSTAQEVGSIRGATTPGTKTGDVEPSLDVARDSPLDMNPNPDIAVGDRPANADILPEVETVPRSCSPIAAGCGEVLVDGGAVVLGDFDAHDPEGPDGRATPQQTSIRVDSFMLDEFEVTVARFRRYVEADASVDQAPLPYPGDAMVPLYGAPQAPLLRSITPNCNWTLRSTEAPDRESHPINCIDWNTAQAFCRWDRHGRGRLPTAAEWELAAQGSNPAESCHDLDTGTCETTSPTYPVVSRSGARHMIGNLWEWVADSYARYDDASCWGNTARVNPVCVAGMNHVAQGGSWGRGIAEFVRIAARGYRAATYRDPYFGFRCAGPLTGR